MPLSVEFSDMRFRPDRRTLLLGAAGIALASKIGAAPPALSVPQVDELSLTILDDKETFGPFLPDQDRAGLAIRYAGNGGGPGESEMKKRALTGEFGLSILAASRVGDTHRKVLVDFGYSPEVLANNMALLGIDPSTIDAAVLSHGHLDHYGGSPALAGSERKRGRDLPLYVGGEETFCDRVAMIGNPPLRMGALDRVALAKSGFEVRIAPQPSLVADHAFSTGLIPLETFERAAIPTRMRPGIGCRRDLLSAAKRDLTELADDGEHELATCFLLRGRGLVIIASCSHRGVLNSIRQAQAISGEGRVFMVIGGFHLVRPRTEAEALRTVAELAAINPEYIVPMHCTGETFVNEALRIMPAKIVRPYVGMRLSMV
jgi:7,8-dihydropterin-6-yl-methyl-4-(beta-D-ribofuranosyl)aminobenzene 5'-phosphate synthase